MKQTVLQLAVQSVQLTVQLAVQLATERRSWLYGSLHSSLMFPYYGFADFL